MAKRQFTRHKAACIKNQVGTLQHTTTAYRNKVWVAWTCTDNFDETTVALLVSDRCGNRNGVLGTLLLGYKKLSTLGGKKGCSLAHARGSDMAGNHVAGGGDWDCSELVGRVELDRVTLLLQQFHDWFITLHINRRKGLNCSPLPACRLDCIVDLLQNLVGRFSLMRQPNADTKRLGNVLQHGNVAIEPTRRNSDEQTVVRCINIAFRLNQVNMFGTGVTEKVCTCIMGIE